MLKRWLAVAVVGLAWCAAAEPKHAPLPLRSSAVQDKNFFVLSLLSRAHALESDPALSAVLKAKAAADGEALKFSDAEIDAVGDVLKKSYGALVDDDLRASGAYVRYDDKSGGDLLAAAWADAARGIDNIIDVYALGKAPRYPAIDAPSYDVKSEGYVHMLHTVAASLKEEPPPRLFFEPSLRYALKLLEINKRDEAGRLEPLELLHASVIQRMRKLDWSRYPYSAIIVPGAGPDRAGWELAPQGKLRLEIAVRRYRQGKAPLILVSGGYVHPNQTPYAEAIEMKKSLIADFGIPADAILIDPHARHTTTNLRNAARLMYRYGAPFDKPALVTTDSFHSSYIEGDAFAKRCQEELGYQPVTIGKRLNEFDLEVMLRADSLQINPLDPLDP